MKKSILTIAGSALIVLSAVQFAAASEPHQGRVHHHAAVRDSNAYWPPLLMQCSRRGTATAVDIRRLPVADPPPSQPGEGPVRRASGPLLFLQKGCSAATIVAWRQQLPNI